jgi:restriction system protein
MKLPTYDRLMNPAINAIRALGGSGSVDEIYDKVVELERIPEEIVSQPHDPERSTQSEVAYRLAWARTYLKKYGLLENSTRGVWSLTPKAKDVDEVDPQVVVKTVRALDKKQGPKEKPKKKDGDEELPDEDSGWREKLHHILTKKLDPTAFERLVQRLLRESGFVQVEVLGRSGDGGIDGKGIARIHGFMSFHVIFQCKRYQGSISAGAIRDFRGAMVGRADKGLFVTTGTFTPAAVKEATRDGAPPIDLVDGDNLADKLNELGLGITKEVVEVATVDESWFESI